ncbi:MAG TPA: ABC transporter ATP-binding protein [Candidatus Methylacidiphilales bacterium]|nr:ABC transporter ATP-binding protein [Candidatus Methylacidiphilales bacterium]
MNAALPLTCSSLRKTFSLGHTDLEILRGLEAAFPQGGLNTIQGASGSGKSTLLQILGGLERPDAGEVRWQGDSIYGWPRARLAAWRNLSVGFVFQAYHLFPELSALENVEFPARLARRSDTAHAAHLLDQVGLGSRLHHRPSELSGGEQQRVAIARALRNDPALLLADEPTGNLDAATGREIIDLLLRLHHERGNCMIIVTHDDRIAALGEQTYRLEGGVLSKSAAK